MYFKSHRSYGEKRYFINLIIIFLLGAALLSAKAPGKKEQIISVVQQFFKVMETPEGWKIAGVIYTVEREGCNKRSLKDKS